MKKIISTTLILLLGCFSAASHSVPVQTFTGLITIDDSINGPSNLVGTNFSIDGDGVFDLNLAYGGVNINSIFGWNATARESSAGSAEIIVISGLNARLFNSGEMIGPGATTVSSANLGNADTFGGFDGEFVPDDDPLFGTKRGFIGFSFTIGGNTHYGWADVEVDITGDFGAGNLNLYGYGYETDPDTAIAAGAGGGSTGTPTTVNVPLPLWSILAFALLLLVIGNSIIRKRSV